jgi:hypothetical protein
MLKSQGWLLGRRGKIFLSSSINGGQMVRAVLNRQTQQARKGISHSINMFGDQINILKGHW